MHSIKLLIFLTYICFSVSKNYKNFTLFRTIPDTMEKLNFLRKLDDVPDYNFWRPPSSLMYPVEFIVSPDEKPKLLMKSKLHNLVLTPLINDVQRALDKQVVKPYVRRRMDSFNWKNYYRTSDIYDWLRDLREAYPSTLELITIGNSVEHRQLLVAKVSINPNASDRVIVEGGIHAREWVSIAVVTYLLHKILTSPQTNDDDLKHLADSYTWYFMPIMNPDGYEYTHVEDRMYRKNKNGVDLNRNFDYAFGTVGISRNPNSEIYCGPKAFSEPETIAFKDFVRSKKNNLQYYLSYHAYGQMIIIPYGNTTEHLDNFSAVKNVADTAARRISERYGTRYTAGTAYDSVGYKTSGNSACWVKKTFNVPYAMTFELRDKGNFGFALPPYLILPTCMEIEDGVVSLMSKLSKRSIQRQSKAKRVGTSIPMIVSIIIFLSKC